MQKIARDRLSAFKRVPEGTEEEVRLCTEIGMAVVKGASASGTGAQRLVGPGIRTGSRSD
jgi:hypothetical protein